MSELFDAQTKLGLALNKKPGAVRRYAIIFTARSGSSWLADLLTNAGGLGEPLEYFNPGFIPGICASLERRTWIPTCDVSSDGKPSMGSWA